MNTFGNLFRLTTYGESHGKCIGGIIDGFPSNIDIDLQMIQEEVNKRRPGSGLASKRKEKDKVEILSGIFNNKSTGAPIAFQVFNTDMHSNDYDALQHIYRPSHADYTYTMKYGNRDYRGGGRASARETANWVVGGAFAKILLDKYDIHVTSNLIYPDIKKIEEVQKSGNSIGGIVSCRIHGDNLLTLGEPIFDKLDGELAKAMLTINGCKGIEFGEECDISILGSEYNKYTGYNGGILGGIADGNDIVFRCRFKPTPSIYLPQEVMNDKNEKETFQITGRHDPCIALRAVPVVTAMARMVIADNILLRNKNMI